MLEVGQRIVIHYPKSTHISAEPQFQRREVIIKSVRDLVRDPLTVEEYCQRTQVRRSRWLVSARDVQIGAWRRFYLGTTREYCRSTPLRLGLFHPDTGRFVKLLLGPLRRRPTIGFSWRRLRWSG